MKTLLPEPPGGLAFEDVSLFYVGVMPGDDQRGLVPYYHHRILVENADVGHIDFKVGDTDHVRLYAGHLGFDVKPMYQGHDYAGKACRALIPLVSRHYDEIILTVEPDNRASIQAIEDLGARYLDEIPVLNTDVQHTPGSRSKRRYRWRPVEFAEPDFKVDVHDGGNRPPAEQSGPDRPFDTLDGIGARQHRLTEALAGAVSPVILKEKGNLQWTGRVEQSVLAQDLALGLELQSEPRSETSDSGSPSESF